MTTLELLAEIRNQAPESPKHKIRLCELILLGLGRHAVFPIAVDNLLSRGGDVVDSYCRGCHFGGQCSQEDVTFYAGKSLPKMGEYILLDRPEDGFEVATFPSDTSFISWPSLAPDYERHTYLYIEGSG